MKHDMIRPCAKCPFRNDIIPYLTQWRAKEIAASLLSDQTFPCHETVDYDTDSNGRVGPDAQQCAGAMIILERQNNPTQMMRICERLRLYDKDKLDMTSPVYANFRAFVDAQPRMRGSTEPPGVTAWLKRIR